MCACDPFLCTRTHGYMCPVVFHLCCTYCTLHLLYPAAPHFTVPLHSTFTICYFLQYPGWQLTL